MFDQDKYDQQSAEAARLTAAANEAERKMYVAFHAAATAISTYNFARQRFIDVRDLAVAMLDNVPELIDEMIEAAENAEIPAAIPDPSFLLFPPTPPPVAEAALDFPGDSSKYRRTA